MELERLQVLLKRYGKLSLGDAMERIAALEAERERDATLIERLKKALRDEVYSVTEPWKRCRGCNDIRNIDQDFQHRDGCDNADARAALAEAEGRKP